jgi:hypothetical protein
LGEETHLMRIGVEPILMRSFRRLRRLTEKP